MRASGNRELYLAFIAILIITLIYAFMVAMLGGIPPAREFFGHSIGIVGFLLMLMTETLYSIRKRSRVARWGRMSAWLDFHIFTGLVGPYLVLLHSSWKFNGLAGVVMLLTVVIVASGFIGRYIYTAVPRTADGVEVEAGLLMQQLSRAEADLQAFLAGSPMKTAPLIQSNLAPVEGGDLGSAFFSRFLEDARSKQEWRRAKKQADPATRKVIDQIEGLTRRKRTLERQLNSLATARRTMALWHSVHIPIGMVLFTAAFIHIVAAVYYATLLR